MVDAETLIVVNVKGRAAAEPDDQAALGDVVEDRQLPGEADRVDISADSVEMMLAKPDNVDPELIGEPRFAQGLVDDDTVPLGVPAVGKQEIAEFHAGSSYHVLHLGRLLDGMSSGVALD